MTYFSDVFKVEPDVLEACGTFNIAPANGLPRFLLLSCYSTSPTPVQFVLPQQTRYTEAASLPDSLPTIRGISNNGSENARALHMSKRDAVHADA